MSTLRSLSIGLPVRGLARRVLPGILLIAVGVALFAPQVLHPSDVLVGRHRGGFNDLTLYFLANAPWSQAWDPFRFAGMPHVGNPQAAMFYPPNWLAWLTDAPARLGWTMVLHHVLAGLGTYLLCRRFRLRRGGALLAGVAMTAAPYLLVHTAEGHYTLVCAAAWIPWGFLAFERLRAGKVGGLSCTAVVLALCLLAGHAQTAFYLALALTCWRLADVAMLAFRGQRDEAGQALVQWALIGLFTAQLAAVDLLPQWQFARLSNRAVGMSAASAGAIGLGWPNLLQAIYPQALGGADAYRGPGLYFHETLCYFGVVALLLAVFGLATTWKRYPSRRMALMAIVAVLFAAGAHGWLFPALYEFLPGISLFRAPARMLLFATLAVAVLAGAGVDQFALRVTRFAAARLPSARPHSRRIRAALAGIAIVLVAAELCWFGGSQLATVPAASLRSESGIAAWLEKRPGEFRVVAPQGLFSDREATESRIEKLEAYEPVAPAALMAALAGTAPKGASPRDVESLVSGFGRLNLIADPDVLNLFNVRYAVLGASQPPPGDGWKERTSGTVEALLTLRGEKIKRGRYKIYENEHALPRAFVVGKVRQATGSDAITALAEIDPREEVILERDALGDTPAGGTPAGDTPARDAAADGASNASADDAVEDTSADDALKDDTRTAAEPRQTFIPAKVVEHAPQRVVVEAELDRPGYLVVSDAWYPGWTAQVDDRPADILRADVAFRAVPLTAGKHTVVMQYKPPGLAAGGLLSLVAVFGLAAFGLVEMSRLRRLRQASAVRSSDSKPVAGGQACEPSSSS